MLDKDRTYALARSAGLPTPATWTLRDLDDLARIDGDVPFPCALKPAESHLWRRHAGATSKAVVVHDRYELDRESRRWLGKGLVMLVTEIIPGPEEAFASYYSYLDPSGRPILHLTKRKLRQNPPGFGRGCYHVTEWVPEVAELGLAFFQRVGLRGLGSVEFKRDSRDGSYKLIECNHRMTAANEQLRRAGVDLALLLYNRAAGLPDPPLQRWSHGVRLWYPLADLRALRRLRSDGELTVAQWVRSVAHRQHLAVFRWSDPLPSVGYGLARLIRLGRRLARRAEASPRDPSEEGVPPGGGAGRTSSATSPR